MSRSPTDGRPWRHRPVLPDEGYRPVGQSCAVLWETAGRPSGGAWRPAPSAELLDASGLPLPRLADGYRLGEGEHDEFFTGDGADVVVQAQHRHPGDILDHRFQDRPRRFDEMGPNLLGVPIVG